MSLKVIKGDITGYEGDCIVNAANRTLLGGGGVDGAIHHAAGSNLLEECKLIGGCEVGKAVITKGYNLKAPYVIHTVGPIWYGGKCFEEADLKSCYENSLLLAYSHGIKSIAFPCISTGVYGYPLDLATKASKEVFDKYTKMDITVYAFSSSDFEIVSGILTC